MIKEINIIEEDVSKEYDVFLPMWEDISRYVRLSGMDVKKHMASHNVFDSTAIWANSMLAAGLMAYLVSSNERWFTIGVVGKELNALPPELVTWMEDVEDKLYNQFANPDSGFSSVMHEASLDETSFGTSIILEEYDTSLKNLKFEACSLFRSKLGVTESGLPDIIYREKKSNAKQIMDLYEKTMEPDIEGDITNDTAVKEFKEAYVNRPLEEYTIKRVIMPTKFLNMICKKTIYKANKYVSVHYLKEKPIILKISGYSYFPYTVARWSKYANETYGRSPVWDCLHSIRMLNAMKKTILRKAQLAVDPILQIPDDSIMVPFSTVPGSHVFMKEDSNGIIPLAMDNDVGISIDQLRDERGQILKAFYNDWIIQPETKVEKTAHQILDKRQEQSLLLSPVISRISNERLGRIIQNSVFLMEKHGIIEKLDPNLTDGDGNPFVVTPMYMSFAARAQQFLKTTQASGWVDYIIKLASVKEEIIDVINFDRLAIQTSKAIGAPSEIINTQSEIKALREARQQREQQILESELASQRAQQTQQLAKASKDVAGQ